MGETDDAHTSHLAASISAGPTVLFYLAAMAFETCSSHVIVSISGD